MTLYKICHQSGRILFTTDNEVTARNREQFGWKVIKVDKSREQFEKWFSDQGKHQYAIEKSNGNYILASANSAWQSWQASRSAVEIELPPAVEGSNVPFAGNAWNAYRVEAVEAVRAAGIKVKE
nr:MAG TPA: hypothetical protein [Caudoviricetes sp.]